jgi:hypothetical protein
VGVFLRNYSDSLAIDVYNVYTTVVPKIALPRLAEQVEMWFTYSRQ